MSRTPENTAYMIKRAKEMLRDSPTCEIAVRNLFDAAFHDGYTKHNNWLGFVKGDFERAGLSMELSGDRAIIQPAAIQENAK